MCAGADRETLRQGVHISRKLAEANAWKGIIKGEKYPGTSVSSDADLDQYMSDSMHSGNALVGTCAMGDAAKVRFQLLLCVPSGEAAPLTWLARAAGGGGEPREPQGARRGGPARGGLVGDPQDPRGPDGRAGGDGGGARRGHDRLRAEHRR